MWGVPGPSSGLAATIGRRGEAAVSQGDGEWHHDNILGHFPGAGCPPGAQGLGGFLEALGGWARVSRGCPCSAPTLSPSPCPVPPRTLTSLNVPDSRHRDTTAQSGTCRQLRSPMQTPRLLPQDGYS